MLLLTHFGSRGDPNMQGTPGLRLRGPSQTSQIWSILGSFLCYYSLTLAPGMIQMCEEPRDPVMGPSSKLADLVHNDQFAMLLLTHFSGRSKHARNPVIRLRGPHQNS